LHVLRLYCEDGRTLLLILSCCGIVPSPAGSDPLGWCYCQEKFLLSWWRDSVLHVVYQPDFAC